ncbi:MAG: thiamine phosphate synthase [Bryobacteraceae bacterium]
MKLPPLYPILDTATFESRGFDVLESARTLIAAGVRILQYRHKREFTQGRYDEAAQIAEECRLAGAKFVINDRADFASLLSAGLHIGQEDLPAEAARQVLGPERLLGFSTHNESQLRTGAQSPADYLALGPMYATVSKEKPDPIVGVAELARLRKLTSKPLVAIGGITIENAGDVLAAGADSVAAIAGLLPDSPDLKALSERVRQWLKATRQ